MRKELPIAEALELAKDQPNLLAQIQDIALDKDTVEVEFDDDRQGAPTYFRIFEFRPSVYGYWSWGTKY